MVMPVFCQCFKPFFIVGPCGPCMLKDVGFVNSERFFKSNRIKKRAQISLSPLTFERSPISLFN